MKRRVLITLAVIVGVLIIAGGLFKIRYDKMVRTFREERVESVYLQDIDDGVYSGSFGDFLVSVTLDVTVSDNRIADISIIEQRGGPGYEALETLDLILEAQTPLVDAVSGATGSSRCIMIAVYKALSDKDL
ncbi:MAG: FMN-binding protein [Candidatus Aegiribacteria sp.]|nr:FMN-binding protein [Candidatus Aegiribacteria sp.]